MYKFLLLCTVFVLSSFLVFSQHGFKFGGTYSDLNLIRYEKDTSANAVVINEFGEAYFQSDNNYNLVFYHHIKIKILKKEGTEQGTIEIPFYRDGIYQEIIRDVHASSYNLVNGSLRETVLESKNIFTERVDENTSVKKFAIPNVQAGSVIEYEYSLETPFDYNFKPWRFQHEIPTIYSEYMATIPANYVYNISLRGYKALDKNDNEIIRQCYHQADCSRFIWGMKDVPAFVEEEYMTAPSNFLSAIRFELSEYHSFSGAKREISKEWSDVAHELRMKDNFGVQLRKGKDVVDGHVESLIAGESDPLKKATTIYDFIKDHYSWNGERSKYTDIGIKKAFEQKKGNSADINLSLVAALKYAGLDAAPLLLSTRDHGAVTDLFPVISEFNYVIAAVKINNKTYLLDATEDLYPFGLLPLRCLNGKGRVIDDRESYWIDLTASERSKKFNIVNLTLDQKGVVKGTIHTTFVGHAAVLERAKIFREGDSEKYIKEFAKGYPDLMILKSEMNYTEDIYKPLVRKLEVEFTVFDNDKVQTVLFNPFILDPIENPFKASERLYPIDYGAPVENITVFNLSIPENFELTDVPDRVGLMLPESGGRFLYEVRKTGKTISVNHSLQISKSIFRSDEYHTLKELYARVIATQQIDLVLKR